MYTYIYEYVDIYIYKMHRVEGIYRTEQEVVVGGSSEVNTSSRAYVAGKDR